jgi:hypothetical protein
MHSEIAEFRDFSARKVRRDRSVAHRESTAHCPRSNRCDRIAAIESRDRLAALPLLGDHSGMSHAIHSPSCLRSASDGAGLSGGMLVLVAAGPDAVVSSI